MVDRPGTSYVSQIPFRIYQSTGLLPEWDQVA